MKPELPLLQLRDLACGYGEQSIVQHLNLHLNRGDIGCLLGPSGCGKTTTLRAIAGFEPVSAATQRKRPPSSFGARSLTADLEDILARSFATPEAPCTSTSKTCHQPLESASPGSKAAGSNLPKRSNGPWRRSARRKYDCAV